MFLSKAITKIQKDSHSPTKVARKTKPTKDEKRSQRCRYLEIPPVQKRSPVYPIYQICGDIPFMHYEDQLVTDISMFNEFKTYQDISVDEIYNQKIISIKVHQRKDKKYAEWTQLVKDLEKSPNSDLNVWAKTIKSFCHTHTKVMQRQSRKRMKSELRRQFFSQVTQQTELHIQSFFLSYPCVHLKFRLKNHQMELKELLFSEWFVKEMGYSTDSFIITVLQEGIPQLMPYGNPLTSLIFKSLLENYFTFGEKGYIIPEVDSTLLMKSNFAKNISLQTLFLMNYETNTFGMDIVIALSSTGEPYIRAVTENINKEFLEAMTLREEELGSFLSQYYNFEFQKVYTNIDKTCSVKELNSDNEDIIVKKHEEENYSF